MSVRVGSGWATGTGEQIMKLDLKLKVRPRASHVAEPSLSAHTTRSGWLCTAQKILNMFAREMESIARKAVDEELASLLHGESRRSFGIGSSFGTAID
jgi:hypothetical protein